MFIIFDLSFKKSTKMYLRDFLYINWGNIKLYINVNFNCPNLPETEKIAEIIKTFTAQARATPGGYNKILDSRWFQIIANRQIQTQTHVPSPIPI